MLPSSVVLGLGGTLLLTVADKVPSLNVEPACRAAAKMGDSLSLDTTLRQCLADEKSARDQLEKEWTQFAPALQQRCVDTTQTGGDPSYVEVLVCLQMGRDARPDRQVSGRRPARQLTMTPIVTAFFLSPFASCVRLARKHVAAHWRATQRR